MTACTLARPVPPGGLSLLVAWPWAIATTVLGLIVWWPLGLLSIALWKAAQVLGGLPARDAGWIRSPVPSGRSGNTAFDEHREAVLHRLEEERRALDAQQREFEEFLQQLRRAKDRDEFDRFMAGRGARPAAEA